ncbi:hypothetical protein MMC08_001966 [Hypocenomyce scalaris]|nr:hypothetical protein [Hypocenomyce scalaris]
MEALEDAERRKIYKWLAAPDPYSNHERARQKHQPDTGKWLLDGQQYNEWKNASSSFLWLHGIPGCGKTLLSSSIIEDISDHCQTHPNTDMAYFYFDFNENEKLLCGNFLRSFLQQLSSQSLSNWKHLQILYTSCHNGERQPNVKDLQSTLEAMLLQSCRPTYTILDALDECIEREEVLDWIGGVVGQKIDTLHFFIASRRERDIEETLNPLATYKIYAQSSEVDVDIKCYIQERLKTDLKLKKWPSALKTEIEAALMQKASGMFRWAVCQLDALQVCLTPHSIRTALKALPKDLDGTYERILAKVPEEYSQYALRILQALIVSFRAMTLEEVAEMLVVDLESDRRVDPDRRLLDPINVLNICSSLVTLSLEAAVGHFRDPTDKVWHLRLAHFSVQEYLVSYRIRTGAASQYDIDEACAHTLMAETCLGYLLQFDKPDSFGVVSKSEDNWMIIEFPLAMYAAEYWIQHEKDIPQEQDITTIKELATELFENLEGCYINWLRLHLPHEFPAQKFDRIVDDVPSPLFLTSWGASIRLTKLLLERGADVNGKNGLHGALLEAAAFEGHFEIVHLLLENGADINMQGRHYSSALGAAAFREIKEIVHLLLKNGADINMKDEHYSSALGAAAFRERKKIVHLLLEKGADINIQGEHYSSALGAAAFRERKKIVHLLLEKGADINIQGGHYCSTLGAAASTGNQEIVHLLLEKGADTNMQESGADINIQGGRYSSALGTAASTGNKEIVHLLLENGADVNIGNEYTPLQAASQWGHVSIVRLLLERGAEINAVGPKGNALELAEVADHESIVKLLLELGADPHLGMPDTSTGSEKESTDNEDEEYGEDGKNEAIEGNEEKNDEENDKEHEGENEEEQESEQTSRKMVRTEMAGRLEGSDDVEPAAKQQKLPIRIFQREENAGNMDVN